MEERKERKLLKEENRSQPRDSLTSAEQLKSQGETDITLFFFFLSCLFFFFFLNNLSPIVGPNMITWFPRLIQC